MKGREQDGTKVGLKSFLSTSYTTRLALGVVEERGVKLPSGSDDVALWRVRFHASWRTRVALRGTAGRESGSHPRNFSVDHRTAVLWWRSAPAEATGAMET